MLGVRKINLFSLNKANFLVFLLFSASTSVLFGSEIDALVFKAMPQTQQISTISELLEENKNDAAIEALEIFLSENPKARNARSMLIVLLIEEKQYAKAEQEVSYLLDLYPDLESALSLQAEIYLSTDRNEEALAIFQKLVQQDPSFANLMRLANTYIKVERYEDAARILAKAIPQTDDERKQKEEYENFLTRIEQKEVIEKAVEYIEIKAFECARLVLIQYLNQNPCADAVRILLGRVYGYEGFFDRGIDQISCVLARDICSLEAWRVLAEIYRGMGLFRKSLWIYNTILAGDCDESTRIGLAYSFLAISNRSGAGEIACNLKNVDLLEDIERPSYFDQTYRYLRDSQDLFMNQYVVRYAWWKGNCFSDLVYDHLEGHSFETSGYLDRFLGSVYLPLNNIWDASLKLGFAHVNGHAYPIGEALLLLRLPWGVLTGSTGYQIYDETAESLNNRIRYSTSLVNYTHTINDRNTIGGVYGYTKYSDGNHNNLVNLNYDFLLIRRVFSYCYKLPFNPEIDIRYDITYQNIARFAPFGYFTGKDYLENRLSFPIISLTQDLERRFELIPSFSYLRYTAIEEFRGWFYGGTFNGYVDLPKDFLFVGGIKGGKYNFIGQENYWYYELAGRIVVEF